MLQIFEQICGLFGLIDLIVKAIDAIGGFFGDMTDFFSDAASEVIDMVGDAVGDAVDAVGGAIDAVGSAVSGAVSEVGSWFGFRRLEQVNERCHQGHYAVCHTGNHNHDECNTCLTTPNMSCPGCG